MMGGAPSKLPVGLIAGSGDFPCMVAKSVRKEGLSLVVAAVERGNGAGLQEHASVYENFGIGEAERLLGFLHENGVRQTMMAGGVPKKKILQDDFKPDALARRVVKGSGAMGDDQVLKTICAILRINGISVLDPARFLSEDLTPRGVLTKRSPTKVEMRDVAVGLKVAKAVGRLDIGQSVVVKGGTVLAVEAIEGTDGAIRRAGEFAGGGAVLVKIAKPQQDLRFDMPVIGASTVQAAKAAGIGVIALQAGRSLMLRRAEVVRAADDRDVSIIGVA